MIIDQYGKPFEMEDLDAGPQTARVGFLHTEFALHPGRGLTPSKLSYILEQAERGSLIMQADLGDDMEERDSHIAAELGKRRRAVTTLTPQITAPKNPTPQEQKAADFVAELMEDINIEEILLDMGDAINKGFAPLEVEWMKAGKNRVPKLELKPQRWFQLPPFYPYTDQLRLRDGTVEGEELIPGGWIMHIHKARPGYVARASLLRILAWPYLFKNYSTRDFAEFLEIYGLPLRLGKYPAGAAPTEKAALLRAVMSIGHNAAGIVPEGMDIEFNEATKGASDPFSAMIDWAERSESKAIVGQVLSAEAKATGMGSGVADLHTQVLDDILQSDSRQMARSMTDFCYLIAVFNGFDVDPGRGPRFNLPVPDYEDMQMFSTAIPALVNVGMQVPEAWARGRLNIPDAQEDERVLSPAQSGVPAALTEQDDELRGAPAIQRTTKRDDQQQLVDAADAAAAEWNELMTQRVDDLLAILDETKDLKLFRERMAELLTAQPPAHIVERLQRAGFAAQLVARLPKR